jgi:hypothetical protein
MTCSACCTTASSRTLTTARRKSVAALLLLVSLSLTAGAQSESNITALTHVRVIDGTGSAPIENATVIVAGPCIRAMGANRDLLYDLRREQRLGKLDGATVYTAGRGIGVPGAAGGTESAAGQGTQVPRLRSG